MGINNYILLVICLLYIMNIIYIFRYNMHMFQLNGYKNGVHVRWLQSNRDKQRVLITVIVLSLICAIYKNSIMLSLLALDLAIILWYYYALSRKKAKINLVYTNRVKRMLITNIILIILISVLSILIPIYCTILILIGLSMCIEPYIIVLVNIINRPVEKAINNYYINDAKKILKNMPNLKIIGVTGSYGKTSVKYYLHTLLQSGYNVLMTPESYNTPMGVVKTIRGSLKPTHEVFICEMGARNIGDIKELCDIVNPTIGVITSIGPQHLDSFLNIDNIISTKFELAESLPDGSMLFLNGDNEYIRNQACEHIRNRDCIKTYYTTRDNDSEDICKDKYSGMSHDIRELSNINKSYCQEYQARDIRINRDGCDFAVVDSNGLRQEFHTKLIGMHNVINILGAITVANKLGIPMSDLTIPVRRIEGAPHRLQMIEGGKLTIIDDAYNSNPMGAKVAIDTLAMLDGTKVLVTPGMVELGEASDKYNYEFGKNAARVCDYIVLVGGHRTKPILDGILESGYDNDRVRAVDKLEEAMEYVYSINANEHMYILLENDLPDNY